MTLIEVGKISNELRRSSPLDAELVLSPYRRSGNTTRLVDNCIQIIFSGHVCVCEDHWEYGKNRLANKNLFERVLDRINKEHRSVELQINPTKHEIVLKNKI